MALSPPPAAGRPMLPPDTSSWLRRGLQMPEYRPVAEQIVGRSATPA